jgi:hypothetical protein
LNTIKLYAHALLDALENKPSDYIQLEDELEDEGFEFEIDAVKNIMYFVVGKNNSHELLDTMLAYGI